MEAGTNGNNFIQEAFRGFLKCLGLDGGAGKPVAAGEESVNSPPPSSTTNYEPLPAADETTSNNPPVDALSSPVTTDSTTMTTMDIDNNLKADQSNYTLVTIDEIINTSGGTTAEAHFVELIDNGQPKMSLLTTSLISSGGGGKSH